MDIKKYILPVVAGVMSGMILQTFGEQYIHSLYPLPPGVGLDNPKALEAYIAGLPAAAFLMLLVNYALCSCIAGVVSTLVGGRNTIVPAAIAGGIILLGGIFNIVIMPHQPYWFSACSLLSHPLFALLGYQLAKSKN